MRQLAAGLVRHRRDLRANPFGTEPVRQTRAASGGAARLARVGDVEPDGSLFLQTGDHGEEILGLRIAGGPKHPDQAFRLSSRCPAKFLETDRGLDVITQDSFAGVDVSRQQGIDSLPQQRAAESRICCNVPLDKFFKASR
jgi:hypothetical protein